MKINKEELKTYKQKLAFIGQLYQEGISLLDFDIANEMDGALNAENVSYTDEQFEAWCGIAREMYLKADEMTIWAMCRAIAEIVKENGEQELLDLGKWDIIERASWLLM